MSDLANKAVFLSYASEDAAAVAKICEALRQAGVEVWFDQNELRGGDAWDQKIRRQIRECALFVPFISAQAQARPEGYFRLEWRLAEQRSHLIAHGRPFIVPIVIDQTREQEALVPDAFLAAQWTRVKSDDTLRALTGQVLQLLQRLSGSAAPLAVPPLDANERAAQLPVIPDFQLLRIIGSGGYGDVWLARGLTGVYRAIKIVWRDRFADAGPFEREFNGLKKFTAMSLPESGQLALLHVGQNEVAGFFYYVMELADDVATGREVNPAKYTPLTLRELRTRRGRLPAAECVAFGVELARALAGLHARGLVHRDIKPSNVILVGGVAKLADIGLVAATSDALTYVGTEGFVPPEGPGKPGADVFALGRLLYELVTGLDREEFPRLPPTLNQLPDHQLLLELNEIILRACEPAAELRYRDASALLADLLLLQAGSSVRRRRRHWLVLGLVATCAVATLGAMAWRWKSAHPPAPAFVATLEKSVAVLPFANLSEDPGNAYFADGVHEDLLANLANVSALKVISRTSVAQYRGTTKTIRQIGTELGVAYILEGSVRRAGNKIRVTGQLINAHTDEHVWARSYDRDLSDVFAVQSELALSIAGALQAVMSPQENARVEKPPTQSVAAYQLYQQARALLGKGDVREVALGQALPLLQQAVEIDPHYARAWAEISKIMLNGYDGNEPAADRLASARQALAKAEAADPDDYEVLIVGSDIAARTGDRPHVHHYRQKIIELFPNRAEAYTALALDAAYEMRFPEALASMTKARSLDPRNVELLATQQDLLITVRRFDEAADADRQTVLLAPENLDAALRQACTPFLQTGSTRELEALSARLKAAPDQKDLFVRNLQVQIALFRGDDPDELIRLWRESGGKIASSDWNGWDAVDIRVLVAAAYLSRKDFASAQPLIELNRDLAQQQLVREPNQTEALNQLGLALGMLGETQAARAALEQARTNLKQLPPLQGRAQRWANVANRAWADEKAESIAGFTEILRSPVMAALQTNVFRLQHSVIALPLHGDPAFEAMVKDPANNAPLF